MFILFACSLWDRESFHRGHGRLVLHTLYVRYVILQLMLLYRRFVSAVVYGTAHKQYNATGTCDASANRNYRFTH